MYQEPDDQVPGIRPFRSDGKAHHSPERQSRTPSKSLAEYVKEASRKYCTKSEALKSLAHIRTTVSKFSLEDDLGEIYNLSTQEALGEPPDAAAIGRFLVASDPAQNYFAVPRRLRPQNLDRSGRVIAAPNAAAPSVTAPAATRATTGQNPEGAICGFDFTASIPLNHLRVRLSPKYASATPAEGYVVAVLSRTHLRLFWGFTHFRYLDWERAARVGTVEWATQEVMLRDLDALSRLTLLICEQFVQFVEDKLRAEHGLPQRILPPTAADEDVSNL